MLRRIFAPLAALVVSLMTASTGAVEIGVARIDITPSGPIFLHGYAARSAESTGVETKIGAQALAIGDDRQLPLVLLTVDSLGVPKEVVEEVAARLKAKVGLPRERFAVAASHTHCAPILKGLAPNIFGKPIAPEALERIERYTRDLTDKLEVVALEALKAREPGQIHFGLGRVGFAANRRTPGGPVDHDLPVLWASTETTPVKVVLASYACHCTSINPAINRVDADWAGYARGAIEADHPGSTAMIAIGCGADSNPAPRGRVEDARAHGRSIGEEVRRVIGVGSPAHEVARLEARLERITIPLDTPPTREQWEALVRGGGAPGYNANRYLERLDRGEPIPESIDYPVQCWAIDNARAFVFLPGEVVVDYAIRLKKELDRERLWVIAYANDVPCYIPSERILREGGYEGGGAMVYYGLPTKIKSGVEGAIVAAVRRVISIGFVEEPQPGPEEKRSP